MLPRTTAHLRPHRLIAGMLLLVTACWPGSATAADDAKLWAALRNGEAFAIMRHALAPGTGDPDNFALTDCSTQRNLSQRGRAQARRIGEWFRAQGIAVAHVYASEWCRCKETAHLLRLGEVKTLAPLNSFFETMARREPQTRALKKWLNGYQAAKPLVLVSHQVNISALTGRFTRSGETIVAQIETSGRVTVLGSLKENDQP